MNLLHALFMTGTSKVPLSIREYYQLKQKGKNIDEIIESYLLLGKANIMYDREQFSSYWGQGGNVKNVTLGLILSKEKRKALTLHEPIQLDKQRVDLMEKYNE